MKNTYLFIKAFKILKTSGFTTLIFLLSVFFISGCDESPTDVQDYDPEPILTCYIFNGEPISEVYLERIAPLEELYLVSEWGISDADIKIYPIDNPDAGDTLYFVEDINDFNEVYYVPASGEVLVPQFGVTYRIEASKPDEDIFLWAETIVPDTFTLTVDSPYSINSGLLNSVVNWNSPNINMNWTAADSAAGYIFSSLCVHGSLIPLDPESDIGDDAPGRLNLQLLNETARSLEVPWTVFYWVGWHEIEIQAVSKDYYEYSLSFFSTEYSNQFSNVNGGLGVFAGISRRGFTMIIQRVY